MGLVVLFSVEKTAGRSGLTYVVLDYPPSLGPHATAGAPKSNSPPLPGSNLSESVQLVHILVGAIVKMRGRVGDKYIGERGPVCRL